MKALVAVFGAIGWGGLDGSISPSGAKRWTGCYAGIHAGIGGVSSTAIDLPFLRGPFGNQGIAWNSVAPPRDSFDLDGSGLLGGGQLGCDVEFGVSGVTMVFGVLADVARTSLSDRAVSRVAADTETRIDIDWIGTARARLGFATPKLLLFASGGFAWNNLSVRASDLSTAIGPGLMEIETSGTALGWVVGAGAEWGMAGNVSLSLEYLHLEFQAIEAEGRAMLPVAAHPRFKFDATGADIVRIGINWRM